MGRLIDSFVRAAVAPFAAVSGYLSRRFGRTTEPERRPRSAADEAEIAEIRAWLAEWGVRGWFEPGRPKDPRPMFEVDRLLFQGRGIGFGGIVIADGDELRAWRWLRQHIDDCIHKRGAWSEDAVSLVGSERFPRAGPNSEPTDPDSKG